MITTAKLSTNGNPEMPIANDLKTADTLLSRTKGLLGRSSLPAGEGLWIKRCNSIHTAFMKFPIDVLFVDKNLKVVSVYENLKPWRITRLHFSASSVIELPAGTLAGSTKGNGEALLGQTLTVKTVDGVGNGR
jgi:uncharacterized membrane protein (UPF0127 family)